MKPEPHADLYRRNLEEGQEFQDFVALVLYRHHGIVLVNFQSKAAQATMGENLAGFEIKNDRKFNETRRVFIEIAEKGDPSWTDFVPSGIYRKDSWIYVVGDRKILFLFPINQLVRMHQSGTYEEKEGWLPGATGPTSRGFLLPEAVARDAAAKIVVVGENGLTRRR